jgi:hypothetical protein
MSFKHTKHWDSELMRSLEKVAQEKGLIKPAALQKNAAVIKKADITTTTNLMENILKLCNGMREQGLVVEANELEENFLNYKQAQTMYEAHKEKGEDLVERAHPEGSHKLEGVEGDEATFEDILDRHAKMLQMIEKKPSGKLSSAKSIIEAVKVALGAPPLVFDPAVGYSAAPNLWSRVVNMFGSNSSGIETASTAGEVGAGEAAGGIAAGTVAAVAAAAVSAAVGAVVGYEIFESKFYATDLEKAGNNVVSQATDVEADMPPTMHGELTSFQASLHKTLSSAGKAMALTQDANPDNLQALQDYASSVQDTSQHAYQLMSMAREHDHPSNLKPGQSGSSHPIWEDLTSVFSGFRDVELAAGNFINVAQKANVDARLAISKIMEVIQAKAKEHTSSQGGGAAAKLISDYKATYERIKAFITKIQANRPADASRQIGYLQNTLSTYLAKEYKEFSQIPAANRTAEIVQPYATRLSAVNDRLNAFQQAKLT